MCATALHITVATNYYCCSGLYKYLEVGYSPTTNSMYCCCRGLITLLVSNTVRSWTARVKASTSRGEWRWALVNVSPRNQKRIGVSTFLFCEDTEGTWDMQEAAVWHCGVSGTEYVVWLFWNGLFGDYNITPKYWILPSVLFVGWQYTATNATRAVTQGTGNTGQGYISYCSIIALDKLWIFVVVFARNSDM